MDRFMIWHVLSTFVNLEKGSWIGITGCFLFVSIPLVNHLPGLVPQSFLIELLLDVSCLNATSWHSIQLSFTDSFRLQFLHFGRLIVAWLMFSQSPDTSLISQEAPMKGDCNTLPSRHLHWLHVGRGEMNFTIQLWEKDMTIRNPRKVLCIFAFRLSFHIYVCFKCVRRFFLIIFTPGPGLLYYYIIECESAKG